MVIFCAYLSKNIIRVRDLTQKNSRFEEKIFRNFGPHGPPPRGTHISASRALIKKRLDASSNLAKRGLHAQFQLIRAMYLARAMAVARNSPAHLIMGGYSVVCLKWPRTHRWPAGPSFLESSQE